MRRLATPWLVGGLFFFLYAATWDRIWQFDATISAFAVEASGWPPVWVDLFGDDHFLFNALGWILYQVLGRPILGLNGYQALQLVSSLCAAWILGWVAAELSVYGAVFLGITLIFWSHASGATSYLAGAAAVLASLVVLGRYLENPTRRNLLWALSGAILPAYVHTGNVIVVFPVLWAIMQKERREEMVLSKSGWMVAARVMGLALIVWLFLGLPYIYVHELYTPSGLSGWLIRGSGSFKWYEADFAGKDWKFDILGNLPLTLRAFFDSGVARASEFPFWAFLLLGAAFLGLIFSLGRGALPDRPSGAFRLWVKTVWLFFGVFTLFYTIWQPGNTIYWNTHWMLFILGLSGLGIEFGRRILAHWPIRRSWGWVFCLSLICLGAWNFYAQILPDTREANAPLAMLAREIPRVAPQNSLILTSGLHWTELKPYIPYFSKRRRIALDLLMSRNPQDQAMRILYIQTRQTLRAGGRVFATADLWFSGVEESFRKNWDFNWDLMAHFLNHFQRTARIRFAPPQLKEPLVLYEIMPDKEFFEHFGALAGVNSGRKRKH